LFIECRVISAGPALSNRAKRDWRSVDFSIGAQGLRERGVALEMIVIGDIAISSDCMAPYTLLGHYGW
jgi:hypothetical protein